MAQNQDNVFEWSDMFTHRFLFQWAGTIKIQLSMHVYLVQGRYHYHLIEYINLFLPWISSLINWITFSTYWYSSRLSYSMSLGEKRACWGQICSEFVKGIWVLYIPPANICRLLLYVFEFNNSNCLSTDTCIVCKRTDILLEEAMSYRNNV